MEEMEVNVLLGMHETRAYEKGEKFTPIKVDLHPEFHEFKKMDQSDLAIITLDRKIKFSRAIRPICLPSPGAEYVRKEAIVAGWLVIQRFV